MSGRRFSGRLAERSYRGAVKDDRTPKKTVLINLTDEEDEVVGRSKKRSVESWTFDVHHGGEFVHNPHLTYSGGQMISLEYMVASLTNYNTIVEMLKLLSYNGNEKIYYKADDLDLSRSLRILYDDASVNRMFKVMHGKRCIELYIEPDHVPIQSSRTQGGGDADKQSCENVVTEGEGDADKQGCGNVVRSPLRRKRKVLACKQYVLKRRNDVERVHSSLNIDSSDSAHTEFGDSDEDRVQTDDENMGVLYHDLGKEGEEYNGDDEAEATLPVDDEINLGGQVPEEVNIDSQVPDELNLESQAPDDIDGTVDGRGPEVQHEEQQQDQQQPPEMQQPELQQQQPPEMQQPELQQQQPEMRQQSEMQQPEMQQPEQQQPEAQNDQHSNVDKYNLRTYFRRRATDNYVIGSACAVDELEELDSEYEPSDELNSLGSDSSDYYDSDDFPEFDMQRDKRAPELKLFMKFADPREFREALRLHSLIKGYSYKLVKNEWARVRAVCSSRTSENGVDEECKWVCHASWDRENKYFQIKTLVDGHTCSKPTSNKNISSTWLGFHYLEAFRDDPSMSGDVFAKMVLRDFGITVPPHSCWRASKVAKELIDGKHKEQYAKIADYANVVLVTNPGSRSILRTTQPMQGPGIPHLPVFESMFVAFDACLRGFKAGCRPFIGLDGCHLKTSAGGILLCAVGRDGNNGMFPIAVAQVSVECKESWGWFMYNLMEALRPLRPEDITFISDRQKVLISYQT